MRGDKKATDLRTRAAEDGERRRRDRPQGCPLRNKTG
jgi:hypothetical protein